MTYTTITVHDEPDEFPCDDCKMDTYWKELENHGDDRLCPDCLDERLFDERLEELL